VIAALIFVIRFGIKNELFEPKFQFSG